MYLYYLKMELQLWQISGRAALHLMLNGHILSLFNSKILFKFHSDIQHVLKYFRKCWRNTPSMLPQRANLMYIKTSIRQTLMWKNELQSQQGDQGMQCHKPHPDRCLRNKQIHTCMSINKNKKTSKANM